MKNSMLNQVLNSRTCFTVCWTQLKGPDVEPQVGGVWMCWFLTQPTNQPTNQPSNQPTKQPTKQPTNQPTKQATNSRKRTKSSITESLCLPHVHNLCFCRSSHKFCPLDSNWVVSSWWWQRHPNMPAWWLLNAVQGMVREKEMEWCFGNVGGTKIVWSYEIEVSQ